jgi:hypothetical protein
MLTLLAQVPRPGPLMTLLGELAVGLFLLGVAGFAIAMGIILATAAYRDLLKPPPPRPSCPYCGFALRRIEVQDLANPFPPGAAWWCDTEDCPGGCFGDPAETGKPEPITEI